MAIHQNALHHDPLEGFVSGLRRTVNRVLVLPLHMVPGFLVEGGGGPLPGAPISPLPLYTYSVDGLPSGSR